SGRDRRPRDRHLDRSAQGWRRLSRGLARPRASARLRRTPGAARARTAGSRLPQRSRARTLPPAGQWRSGRRLYRRLRMAGAVTDTFVELAAASENFGFLAAVAPNLGADA